MCYFQELMDARNGVSICYDVSAVASNLDLDYFITWHFQELLFLFSRQVMTVIGH